MRRLLARMLCRSVQCSFTSLTGLELVFLTLHVFKCFEGRDARRLHSFYPVSSTRLYRVEYAIRPELRSGRTLSCPRVVWDCTRRPRFLSWRCPQQILASKKHLHLSCDQGWIPDGQSKCSNQSNQSIVEPLERIYPRACLGT